MTDPRFIPPSDREYDRQHVLAGARPTVADYLDLSDHAAFMDERDARQRELIGNLRKVIETCEQVIEVGKANETRQRDLIRRLADAIQEDLEWCESVGREPCRTCKLITEARGIEAPNE